MAERMLPYIEIGGEDALQRLEKGLQAYPGEALKAVVRALNRVGNGVKTDIVRETARRYALDRKRTGDSVAVRKATYSNKGVRVLVRNRKARHVSEWNASETGEGVEFMVKKGEVSWLDHAFIAPGQHSGKPIVFMRTTAERYPIQARYTTTGFEYLAEKGVHEQLQARAGERLLNTVEQELRYRLAKMWGYL